MPVYTLEPDDRGPLPAPPPRFRDWLGRPAWDVVCWPAVAGGILTAVLIAAVAVGRTAEVAWASLFAWLVVVVVLGGMGVWPNRRLLRAVRGFRTLDRPACVVHHGPTVHPTDVELAVRSFERNLADLERAFGIRLRFRWGRRARVYLFRTTAEVARTYPGPHPFGAYAIPGVNGIALSALGFSPELVRHETAHLFAFTAGGRAPRVLEEGLAMWAQWTYHGRGPHDSARAAVRATDEPSPERLLPVNWTDADALHSFRCYTLAGSFTGYLIGRFGWPAYWRLYRGQTPDEGRFRRRFERLLGESFAAARADWLTRLRQGKLTGRPDVGSFEVSD